MEIFKMIRVSLSRKNHETMLQKLCLNIVMNNLRFWLNLIYSIFRLLTYFTVLGPLGLLSNLSITTTPKNATLKVHKKYKCNKEVKLSRSCTLRIVFTKNQTNLF